MLAYHVEPVPPVPRHMSGASRRARRYAIWAMQRAAGSEPCFGTPARYGCGLRACPYRAECFELRAAWRT